MPAPHRIRRQRWEVRVPDKAAGFAARTELRGALETSLLPAMSEAFDAMCGDDEIIHIPRLTLHIRLGKLEALASDLPAQLPALLREQIEAALAGRTPEGGPVRHIQRATGRRNTVMHYLQSGHLAWYDAPVDGNDATPDLATVLREEALPLASQWLRDPATLQRSLPQDFGACVAFIFRYLQLLPETLRTEWVPAMLDRAPNPASVLRWRYPLRAFLGSMHISEVPTHSLLLVQAATLTQLWVGSPSSMQALRELISPLSGVPVVLLDLLDEPVAARSAADPATARRPSLPQQRPDAVPRTPRTTTDAANMQPHDEAPQHATPPATEEPASSQSMPPLPLPTAQPRTEEAADAQLGLRVAAAGLVLAHPFLSSLLLECRLLDDNTIPAAKLPRAAALLHWLAWSREEIHEFELGLIKPLLGLSPDAALAVSPGLIDDTDKAECQALLAAMVSHWPALRSTSTAGLQSAFLQRSGLLREFANGPRPGWQLQPEPHSFDMLLAQLPWSLSIVRLPWMTRPIFTDWPTP
ncbi:MAG: contractile injection system tape measure protein [Rhodocyclaceae bacterium]